MEIDTLRSALASPLNRTSSGLHSLSTLMNNSMAQLFYNFKGFSVIRSSWVCCAVVVMRSKIVGMLGEWRHPTTLTCDACTSLNEAAIKRTRHRLKTSFLTRNEAISFSAGSGLFIAFSSQLIPSHKFSLADFNCNSYVSRFVSLLQSAQEETIRIYLKLLATSTDRIHENVMKRNYNWFFSSSSSVGASVQ